MENPPPQASRRFYRTTRTDCKVAGVCGGLARYFELDPTLVRILFVILLLASFGTFVVAYVVFWVASPSEDTLFPPAQPPPRTVYR